MKATLSVLALGLVSFVTLGAARGQGTDPFLLHKTPQTDKVFLEALKGTLFVGSFRKTGEMNESRLRSGFVIDKENRLAVTQYSALAEKGFTVTAMSPMFAGGMLENSSVPYQERLAKGDALAAKVIATAPKSDLAIIQLDKLPEDMKPLRLAKGGVRAGQHVLVICAAYSTKEMWTYSPGIVSSVAPQKWHDAGLGGAGFDFDCRVLETQHFLVQAQMGGPVVNDRGEVVAMNLGAAGAGGGTANTDLSEIRTLLASKEVTAITKGKGDVEPEKTEKPARPAPTTAEEKAKAKTEAAAASKLRLAKSLIKTNKKEAARQRCEELIKAYPDTVAAEEAKKLLEELGM